MKHHAVGQRTRDRITRPVAETRQPLDQTFDEPFGHRLAGMLARDDPHVLLRLLAFEIGQPEREQRHRPALHGLAEFHERRERHLLNRAEEFRMTLLAVRLEIRIIDAIEVGRVVDLAVVLGRHAEVEPLREVRVTVAAHTQADVFGILCVDDFDRARVEVAGDGDAHRRFLAKP